MPEDIANINFLQHISIIKLIWGDTRQDANPDNFKFYLTVPLCQ